MSVFYREESAADWYDRAWICPACTQRFICDADEPKACPNCGQVVDAEHPLSVATLYGCAVHRGPKVRPDGGLIYSDWDEGQIDPARTYETVWIQDPSRSTFTARAMSSVSASRARGLALDARAKHLEEHPELAP
jgi:hypothetical protein